jgi:hypothetical protein
MIALWIVLGIVLLLAGCFAALVAIVAKINSRGEPGGIE